MSPITLGILANAAGGFDYWILRRNFASDSLETNKASARGSAANFVGARVASVNLGAVSKYSSSGSIAFERRNTISNSNVHDVKEASNGDIYACGDAFISPRTRAHAIRYDSSMTAQEGFGLRDADNNTTNNFAYHLMLSTTNRPMIAGTIARQDSEFTFTTMGMLLLGDSSLLSDNFVAKRFDYQPNSGNSFSPTSLDRDSSDNYYLAYRSNFTANNVNIAKLNANTLTLNWAKQVEAEMATSTNLVVDRTNNKVYWAHSTRETTDRFILNKLDTNGTLEWARAYTSSGDQRPVAMSIDSVGNVYSMVWASTFDNAVIILKYNSSGTLLWQRKITLPDNLRNTRSLEITSEDKMAITLAYRVNTYDAEIVLYLPTDGSLTGTYNVGGANVVYEEMTGTSASFSASFGTATPSIQDFTLTKLTGDTSTSNLNTTKVLVPIQ